MKNIRFICFSSPLPIAQKIVMPPFFVAIIFETPPPRFPPAPLLSIINERSLISLME